jgi:hypothetical protein
MQVRTYFAELLTKEISELKNADAEAPLLIELLEMEMTLLHIKSRNASVPFCDMLLCCNSRHVSFFYLVLVVLFSDYI